MYKIVCNITGEVYYGHTTQKLDDRRTRHIRDAISILKKYCSSRQIINRGDWKMIEIEKYPCANVKEARARERWWIENNACINVSIPGRTKKEYVDSHKEQARVTAKLYQDLHKEEIRVKHKLYYASNKEHIAIIDKVRNDWISSWDGSSRRKGLNQIAIDLFD